MRGREGEKERREEMEGKGEEGRGKGRREERREERRCKFISRGLLQVLW